MKMTKMMRTTEPNDETRPMTTPVKAEEGVDFADMIVLLSVRRTKGDGRYRQVFEAATTGT